MSDEVKTQNAPFLLRACIANRRHGAVAWDFTARNWDETNRRFPTNTIVRMVDSVKLLADPAVVASNPLLANTFCERVAAAIPDAVFEPEIHR